MVDPKWVAAMTEELRVLEVIHTWDLVARRLEMNVIALKWVFWVKQNADGSLDR